MNILHASATRFPSPVFIPSTLFGSRWSSITVFKSTPRYIPKRLGDGKILTSKLCLALFLGPEGFFALGKKHTYLNDPTVSLKGQYHKMDICFEGLNILISAFCLCADGFQGLSKDFYYLIQLLTFYLLL